MNIDIVCPSGLRGEVRGLRVAEANELASAVGKKRLGITAKILSGCWVKTHDPGPYKLDDSGIQWDNVLQGDCDYALIQTRVATFGPEYAFAMTCAEGSCRSKFEWELSLADLEVKRFTDEERETFIAGNSYTTALPGTSRKVTFSLPIHKDQRRAATMRSTHRDELITLALRMRVKSIEGIEPHLLQHTLTDMGLSDAIDLVEAMDERDCGVDTDIEVECPECFLTQEVRLPLGKEFWFQGAKTRRRLREGNTKGA